MITKQITFEDASGRKLTEEWCFNISKAELAKEMLMGGDDMQTRLQNIVKTQDMKLILPQFEEILRMAVGKRNETGRQFIKNKELADDFMYSGAFFSLFMELMTDETSGAEFLNKLLPQDMMEEVRKDPQAAALIPAAPEVSVTQPFPPGTPAVVEQLAQLTQPVAPGINIDGMSEDQLRALLLGQDEMVAPVGSGEPGVDNRPLWLKEQREPTKDELRLMGKDELALVFRAKSQGILNRASAAHVPS
jgi:hypothetical protein